MVGVYLAKTAIMLELASTYGKIIWLDAGLLFSVNFDHSIPTAWKGYDANLLANALQPLAEKNEILTMTVPRKSRVFKNHRPSFHGLSFNDMTKLANSSGAMPDDRYLVAGAIVLNAKNAQRIEDEFPTVWSTMLDQGRIGTEENVLSIMRWKENWPSLTVGEWMANLTAGSKG